ncbi:MAG: hypothetical protein U0232_24500 [Thermomicrobiales bacterium]
MRRGIADLPQALVAATAQQSLILVLDDYHAITSASIHAALAEIIAAAPTGLHLVLASRNAPPFPLARLRARGELLEIGAGDLRFTTGETGALLAQRHGLTLEPAALAALDARAEGWAAALQLVARSLQGRDADEQGAFITAFDGEQRRRRKTTLSQKCSTVYPRSRAASCSPQRSPSDSAPTSLGY